jgi:hypothetical protein
LAFGKAIGEFFLKSTSTHYAEEGESVQIRYYGTATGYATVLGTMTLRGEPGAKSGPCTWRGQGFLDNREVVFGAGQGTWEVLSKHHWRTRMIVSTSDGGTHATDGKLDLKTRSLSGKMFDWS